VRLFRRGSGPESSDPRFLGRWFGVVGAEPVEITFQPDGRMRYVVQSGGKQQLMLLTWRVDGDAVVTNQPSHPREERTPFRFEGPELILVEGAAETRLTRSVSE
jgi:hypothetical protein